MLFKKGILNDSLMDSLWNSAAEGDVQQIMSSILLGKKENKEDFEFYYDQLTERKGTKGAMSKNLSKRDKEKEQESCEQSGCRTQRPGQ